ncbi:hypothetical protein ACWDZ8_42850, partial [Streptomyces sp. NPDC003233]
ASRSRWDWPTASPTRRSPSADPAHLAGSLTKGPDFGELLGAARPGTYDGMRLVPCRGVPLVLVLA